MPDDPCHTDIDEIMHSVLCSECRKGILPVAPSQPRFGVLHKVHAAGLYVYDGILRSLIIAFKYKDKTGLSDAFGKMLFFIFNRYWKIGEIDMIAPVPLHISRLKKRGFNQALLMLRNWRRLFGRINAVPIPINPELLVRVRATKPQFGLGAADRKTNLKDAFAVQYSEKIRGKTVLLIDDVYTTGTTVSECAKVLLHHGAKRVDVLTLAKTESYEA